MSHMACRELRLSKCPTQVSASRCTRSYNCAGA
jgi:hypothetical protein